MKKNQSTSADAGELRRRAEERLKEKTPETGLSRKEADQQRLLHELQVHQIELELQNEQLRQAQGEIQAGLEKYTDLYEFAPMGYFSLDRDGVIRAANLPSAGLLGIERARLMSKQFWRFIEPESRPAFKACLEAVFERKAKETCEVALLKKGGQTLFVRIEATLSEIGQECRAVVMDITARKLVEEALQESENKFRSSFEHAPVGMCLLAVDGRFLQVNGRFCRMFGYSANELQSMTFRQITHPDDLTASEEWVRQLLAGEAKPPFLEKRYLHKAGHVAWSLVHACLLRRADGSPLYLIEHVQDITERRQAEAREKLVVQILDLLNKASQKKEMALGLLTLVKDFTGFEAVGLRLREGEDFPYYTAIGFPAEFVEAEKYLCALDPAGESIPDSTGHPFLECMCGNVLCGRINLQRSFFTPGGSFWTNSTTELLANTSEADGLARIRDGCLGQGYESVALIPLRSAGKVMGLLQLNDRRKGQLRPEMVAFFEGISASIGIALAHQQAEAERERLIGELQDTLTHVKTLHGLLPICASCKKIRDDKGYWNQIEAYVEKHTEALFSHGLCPDCGEKLYPKVTLSSRGRT
jgi:PAS domain S-box-containing protein